MKSFSETFQNLPYFWNLKIHIAIGICVSCKELYFWQVYFLPNCMLTIDPDIHIGGK